MADAIRSSAPLAKITVEADIFKDGHDVVSAVLKWRKQEKSAMARNGDGADSRQPWTAGGGRVGL